MSRLFYRPEYAFVGDNMPCYHNGRYYLYYQCDRRIPVPFPKGEPFGWSLAISEDLVSFTDYGEVLHKGNPDGCERCLYAGSVINHDDVFYAFYTGENKDYLGHPELPPKEVFMIALSKDGIEWEKKPELMMAAPEGMEKDYFRDPCVYQRDDGVFILLVCARKAEGPKIRRGVLLQYESNDLLNWEYRGIFYDPEMYFLLQMPDLFRIGDWYYLLFSELDDQRRTRYRMSRSLSGPWITPPDDCFDGRCYYAARTISAEDKRYMFGWIPTRDGNDDLSMWIWGGNSECHEIRQRKDGTLSVSLPEFIAERFSDDGTSYDERIELFSADGCDEITLLETESDLYKIEFDFGLDDAAFGFGIKIYENSGEDIGYAFHFIPGENRFEFDKSPNYPWFRCMNRGLSRPAGRRHHCTLVVDDDMAVMYVDDVALSTRMTEKPGHEVKFYVHSGRALIENISFSGGFR